MDTDKDILNVNSCDKITNTFLGRKTCYNAQDKWFPGNICKNFPSYDIQIWSLGGKYLMLGVILESTRDAEYEYTTKWILKIEKSTIMCDVCHNRKAWHISGKHFENEEEIWAKTQFEMIQDFECYECLGTSIKSMYHVVGPGAEIYFNEANNSVDYSFRTTVWVTGFEIAIKQEVRYLLEEHNDAQEPRPTCYNDLMNAEDSILATLYRSGLVEDLDNRILHHFNENIDNIEWYLSSDDEISDDLTENFSN
jgi:hypothetical protein